MQKALYILRPNAYRLVYAPVHEQITALVDVYAEPLTADSIHRHPDLLNEADIVFRRLGHGYIR